MRALGDLVLPSGAAYLLFILGVLAAAWPAARRTSWWLLAGSGLITLVFSSGMVAAALMSPLEYEYPTVHHASQHPEAQHIVVLTAWASDDPLLPLTGRFSASTAYRVLMTLELARERPDCDVIVSGSAVTARIMAQALAKLGVPAAKIRVEDASPTTADSAANVRPFVGDEPFYLVTSGGHMPRSIAAFRQQGLNAIAVPTDHQLPRDWTRAELQPGPGSLVVSNLAVHEYLARLWYWLRGVA